MQVLKHRITLNCQHLLVYGAVRVSLLPTTSKVNPQKEAWCTGCHEPFTEIKSILSVPDSPANLSPNIVQQDALKVNPISPFSLIASRHLARLTTIAVGLQETVVIGRATGQTMSTATPKTRNGRM